jgi:tyrosyl-tRNA synthetase
MDMERVEFMWSSEEINNRAAEYWPLVMDIARKNKIGRIIRCSQIMGRAESDDLSASQIFYPCMQVAETPQNTLNIPLNILYTFEHSETPQTALKTP